MIAFLLLFPVVAMVGTVVVMRWWCRNPVYRGRHVRDHGVDIFKPVPVGFAPDGALVYRRLDGKLTGKVTYQHGLVIAPAMARRDRVDRFC